MSSTPRTLQAGCVLLKTNASKTPSKVDQHSFMSRGEETLEKKKVYWALSIFSIQSTRFTWSIRVAYNKPLPGEAKGNSPSTPPRVSAAEKESHIQGRHLC